LNAVWLSCYIAITSLSTICLYISYILPIVCKLLYPHTFIRGPFHLGRFSTLINIIAFIWVCCIVILFVLPPIYPVTAVTMNYASVGVGSVIIFAGLAYYLSAKYWFQGPITNLNFHTEKIDVFMRHL
jgi:hypothetical protein